MQTVGVHNHGSSRFKDVPTMNFKVNEPIKNADAVIDELVEALG